MSFKQEVYPLVESGPPNEDEPFYQNYETGVPIALDLGSSSFKVGLTNSSEPNNVFPSLIARYRDRKAQKSLTLIGNDVYRDSAFKSSIKSPFDGPLINNWDYIEDMLDYSFEHLSVTSDNGKLNNPLILNEPACVPLSQRRMFYELLYETYSAPKITFGIDSLFSHYANVDGTKVGNALVIGTGHESTHIIPVVDGRGVLSQTKRIEWGGSQSSQILQRLLGMKYPYFPSKISINHAQNLFKDHCYVSLDYQNELAHYLDMENLIKNDRTIQAPVELPTTDKKKSDEELAKQAEKRREQGKRLQQQAKQKRIEKLIQKEKEFEYYSQLKLELDAMTSKNDIQYRIEEEEFESLADFNKYLSNLEKSLKKARNEDVEDEEDDKQQFTLVDIPDEELNEDQIKEKRKQKLMKANKEARERAKEAKREEEELAAKIELEQKEWRERDLDGWCKVKRQELAEVIEKIKERKKTIDSFKDRKSAAAQERMKNIATLANDSTGSTSAQSRKRRRNANATIDNDPNDTFGANDDDWAVYRDITNQSLEDEQKEDEEAILNIEAELLKYDPNFTREDTFAAQNSFDWKSSVLHKFTMGPYESIALKLQNERVPLEEIENNPEVIKRNNQIHLNIERIRVPEILFQPNIAGVDQAGITHLAEDLVCRRLDGNFAQGGLSNSIVKDIFITGGLAHLPNFEQRIRNEFTSFLPYGTNFKVRTAKNPITDSWKGMAKWAQTKECENSYVTKAEYDEMGPEYIKEHNLGNVCLK